MNDSQEGRATWNGKFHQCPNVGQQHSGSKMASGSVLSLPNVLASDSVVTVACSWQLRVDGSSNPKKTRAECKLASCVAHL